MRKISYTNHYIGLLGNDRLLGSSFSDLLLGLSGHDQISGMLGDDMIRGGKGHDTLMGGSGNDQLFGDLGRDILRGGLGDDFIQGGKGRDMLYGARGDDELIGGIGNDTLAGGTGENILNGGDGEDTALFVKTISSYEIALEGNRITITDIQSQETTTLESVEKLSFSDASVEADELSEISEPPSVNPPPEEGASPAELFFGDRNFTVFNNEYRTTAYGPHPGTPGNPYLPGLAQGLSNTLSEGGGDFEQFEHMPIVYEYNTFFDWYHDRDFFYEDYARARLLNLYNVPGGNPNGEAPPETLIINIEAWQVHEIGWEQFLDQFVGAISLVREILPDTLLGVYGLGVSSIFHLPVDDAWREYHENFRPLFEPGLLDFISPSLYTWREASPARPYVGHTSTQSWWEWNASEDLILAASFGVPIIPFLHPTNPYTGVPINTGNDDTPEELFMNQLNFLKNFNTGVAGNEHIEGAYIWTAYTPYNENTSWVNVLNQFVRQANASDQTHDSGYRVFFVNDNADHNIYEIQSNYSSQVILPEFDVGTDKLDLSQLLAFNTDEDPDRFVKFINSSEGTLVAINEDGAGSDFTIVAFFETQLNQTQTVQNLYDTGSLILL